MCAQLQCTFYDLVGKNIGLKGQYYHYRLATNDFEKVIEMIPTTVGINALNTYSFYDKRKQMVLMQMKVYPLTNQQERSDQNNAIFIIRFYRIRDVCLKQKLSTPVFDKYFLKLFFSSMLPNCKALIQNVFRISISNLDIINWAYPNLILSQIKSSNKHDSSFLACGDLVQQVSLLNDII